MRWNSDCADGALSRVVFGRNSASYIRHRVLFHHLQLLPLPPELEVHLGNIVLHRIAVVTMTSAS